MNVSQSQILLYRDCAFKYAMRYKFKEEPILFDDTLFEVGKRVHDSADKYYKRYFLQEGTAQDIFNIVYRLLRDDWDTKLPAELLLRAYHCLQNFSIFEGKNLKRDIVNKPLSEVKIPYDGFFGIIDYFDLNRNKCIDFKTSTRAGLGYKYRIQAMMYKILIKGMFNIDIKDFTFEFLFPGEPRIIRFDDKNMKGIEQELYDYKDKIQASWKDDDFPKNPRTLYTCNSCDYRYYCGGTNV